ncbi:hypothetical protein CVIRNUC_010672 [Coccomyxa viridis]|uniref:Uncharacterized protein n=1 Tax=Coccomyxa viridis TaxID=1274662 RepID=A0AAV1IMJ2_9CHLO|nr:hypothetical protein CVIRNUC_010672 [Coccomyxa viridis]
MAIVTFSEAFPGRRGGRRGKRGGKNAGGNGRGAGASETAGTFQGRGQSLVRGAPAAAPRREGTGIFAAELRRPGAHASYQDAVQAWQERHDDAALMALADRVELQQQSPVADELHASAQAGEEKPIDLCDSSDDDAPAQQPAGAQEHRQRFQAAAHPPEARRVKQQPAPGPGPEHTAEAVQRPEAKRLKAGAIQKPAQRTETQQLGIRDPRPPKLSGNNALLKELAEGTNRAKQARQPGADWMFGGSGAYAPHPGSSTVDMKLRLHETVSVFDIGLAPHPARALLDSGNGGCTLICRDFAARLGLVDASGRPRQASVRLTTVRGVVAGASEQIPLMALSYELRGKKMHITAGVTGAKLGCDLLLSCREIAQFISDGFSFDIR